MGAYLCSLNISTSYTARKALRSGDIIQKERRFAQQRPKGLLGETSEWSQCRNEKKTAPTQTQKMYFYIF
jgi:hypothetical protein